MKITETRRMLMLALLLIVGALYPANEIQAMTTFFRAAATVARNVQAAAKSPNVEGAAEYIFRNTRFVRRPASPSLGQEANHSKTVSEDASYITQYETKPEATIEATTTTDTKSTEVIAKAPAQTWSAYFGSFVPTRVSDAWKNNSYYNNQIAYGVGALAAGYTAYKLGKAAYNWYNTPSKVEMKDLVKEMTLEAATKAKSDVAQFARELSTMVDNGFAQLGLGHEGKAMKSVDEIFTAKLSKENPLADALLVQQTAMKDMYTQLKGRIEQWQKDKKDHVAGRMPYGELYNKTVVAALNDAMSAINVKIVELAPKPA